MEFGNWNVTEQGIKWKNTDQFTIPGNQLIAERPGVQGDGPTYDWILQATDQEWLSQNDLYDLNYAFVYAAAKLGLNFSYETFDNTLDVQYDLFDDEEEDDY